MAKRDTYKYELTQGNKVVYVGITNNTERREAEHRQDKDFTTMRIVGRPSTLSGKRIGYKPICVTTVGTLLYTTKTSMVSKIG